MRGEGEESRAHRGDPPGMQDQSLGGRVVETAFTRHFRLSAHVSTNAMVIHIRR
ncbi:hypothetical protein [Nonomuraea terrae]|uniref:hypothetical protein n=1 Tax=Nonomuraea terrae TaxID=2530383 RepID=UPI0014050D64|nr:hypothetical protein [Nonomuraea terrae]